MLITLELDDWALRSLPLNPKERETIAFHETGHALVAMALPGSDPVQKVSIIPRGIGALGYTLQRPIEDRFVMSRDELENRLTVLLGGRAAETLHFPSVSTGATDDLRKATEIARSMVTRFGMVPELGAVAYGDEPSSFLTPVPGAPSVPDVPFPIVIANKTGVGVERMTAISMVGSPVASGGTFTITYNVTRGTPTEGMSQPAVHAGGARVMSTPLPIIPNDPTTFPAPYTPQTQANMCIAQHGFDSFALGPDGKVRLLYFTTVIDIGDGFVRVGQQ